MKLEMVNTEPTFCAALAMAERDGTALRVSRLVNRIAATVTEWQDRAQTRRELARLDERTLHDIGLNRMDAEFEARKPFWRN